MIEVLRDVLAIPTSDGGGDGDGDGDQPLKVAILYGAYHVRYATPSPSFNYTSDDDEDEYTNLYPVLHALSIHIFLTFHLLLLLLPSPHKQRP